MCDLIKPGAVHRLTSDKPVRWLDNHRGDPVMVADPGDFRLMTAIELSAYLQRRLAEIAGNDG